LLCSADSRLKEGQTSGKYCFLLCFGTHFLLLFLNNNFGIT
jgi:hypothetical protein